MLPDGQGVAQRKDAGACRIHDLACFGGQLAVIARQHIRRFHHLVTGFLDRDLLSALALGFVLDRLFRDAVMLISVLLEPLPPLGDSPQAGTEGCRDILR